MAKYSYIILVIVLGLSSCHTMEQISIDYMLPAEVSFPAQLRKVAVVNNMSETPDNRLKPEENKNKEENEISRAVAYFTGYPQSAAESLAKAIAGQNYFDEVIICDSALRANDHTPRESTLSSEEVKELAQGLGADVVIALENLQIKATKALSYLPEWNCYYGTLDAKVYPTVKVYLLNRKGPMVTINNNDSIFWEEYGNTEVAVRNHLPTDKQMLSEASEFAGSLPVKYLLPYWRTSYRYIFVNGSVDMRDAAIYAKEKEWEKACKLWERAYNNSKSDKKKMRAAFNIALYYEMNDKLEEAEKWATVAQTLAQKVDKVNLEDTLIDLSRIPNYYLATLYVNELKERTEGMAKLEGQMSRFNDDF